MPVPIGIGITTYNRLDHLRQVIDAVVAHTRNDYIVIVADDGSSDGTAEYLGERGITSVGSCNRGIAWNKNRALYPLMMLSAADPIIILEDDTLPTIGGWETDWMATVARHDYCTYAHPKIGSRILAGSGTPEDPFASLAITSQCAAVSRRAVEQIGYFDTRFQGYGIEDGEWTTRLRNAGYGIIRAADEAGEYQKANVMISGGVTTLEAASYRDNHSVRTNRDLFAKIRDEPVPRLAWRSAAEQALLKCEIDAGLARQPLRIRTSANRSAPGGSPATDGPQAPLDGFPR